MSKGWIIFLIIAAVIAAGGYVGYRVVKNKLETLSMAMFGTKTFAKGLEKQADMLAETPKSVSGMTRIFEPQIRRDFPDFNLIQFRNKVENMLVMALRSISEENTELLPDVSEELRAQVENRIADNRAAGNTEVYSQIKVHRTEITDYKKKDGTCVITFQSAVEHYHYIERDGELISGEKERKEQTKYNTELVYIQDEKLAKTDNAVGTTCPNCGAPITKIGAMRCEYCGLAVTPINLKVWTLHRFYEVDYHHV